MTAAPSNQRVLEVQDLGPMSYPKALEYQRAAHTEVLERREDPESPVGRLFLVEHNPPVLTVSRRPGAREHILATPQMLDHAGIEVEETDRGGDITYHGPGQLVAYPILDLNRLGLNLHAYMRLLEQAVIDVCGRYAVDAGREPSATGVWVGPEGDPKRAKVCAMGIRVRRWVSMHGLALNVTTSLEHFSYIVPCGLVGRPVTSLSKLLGEACPSMQDVKSDLIDTFAHHINATSLPHDASVH